MKGALRVLLVVGLLSGMTAPNAAVEASGLQRIKVEVDADRIAMTEHMNKVPVLRARIRSMELREVLKKYEAKTIERVFQTLVYYDGSEKEELLSDTFIITFPEDVDMSDALDDFMEVDIVDSAKLM